MNNFIFMLNNFLVKLKKIANHRIRIIMNLWMFLIIVGLLLVLWLVLLYINYPWPIFPLIK